MTLFTVRFSSMYSRCDLSTGIFYTNIWMDFYLDITPVDVYALVLLSNVTRQLAASTFLLTY